MTAEWFIALGDVQIGPVPLTDIETRWRTRQVSEDTLVWRPGMTDWQPLAEVEDLVYLLVRVPQSDAVRPVVMVPSVLAPERVESLAALATWEMSSAEKRSQPTDDVLKLADLAAMGLPAITPVARWGMAMPVPQERRPSISWTWRIATKPPPRVRPAFLIAAATAVAVAGLFELGRRVTRPAAPRAASLAPASALAPATREMPSREVVAPALTPVPKPTTPRARASANPPRSARPPLTRDMIVSGVRAQAKSLSPCLKAARADGDLDSGRHTFVLSWNIAANGSVTGARLSAPGYALDTELPACFARVVRGWEFPASAHDTPIKNFPLPVTLP